MADTEQISIRLPRSTLRLIEALVALETYGDDRTEVIYRFVDDGLRRAQRDGDLPSGPHPSQRIPGG